MLSLTACGDPLADFERIEDVELAPDAPVAQALPDADDVAPTDGLLAQFLNRKPVISKVEDSAKDAKVIVDEASVVSETDAAVAAVINGLPAADVEKKKPVGISGWLRRAAAAQAKPSDTEQVEAVLADVAEKPADVVQEQGDDVASVVSDDAVEDLVEPAKRRGLFGLLQPVQGDPETVRAALLQPEAVTAPEPSALAEPKKRRGLFGSAAREKIRSGPDARDVSFGTVLPYGEVARVCAAKNKESLGRRLDQAPARGRGYSLYDSAPLTVGARTFYVTGFKDNCPRQFTAALAVFGSPRIHEQLRYGLPSKSYPYSTTDKAYEKVKSTVCRVGKSKPCGAKMISLERSTVFISTYEKFSDNARWADILLHDGAVVAAAIKTP